MKLFRLPFVRKDYATLSKLETFMVKELGKHGYNIRRDVGTSFVISSDRADCMTISFKVYKRSFDLWTTDAFGVQNRPVQSCYGSNWREYMKYEMRDIIHILHTTWVNDGHVINTKWSQMMQEIAYPDAHVSWENAVVPSSFKHVAYK